MNNTATATARETVRRPGTRRSFLCRKDDPQGGQHHLSRDAAFQRKRQGGYERQNQAADQNGLRRLKK